MDRDDPLSLPNKKHIAKDLANSVSYVNNFSLGVCDPSASQSDDRLAHLSKSYELREHLVTLAKACLPRRVDPKYAAAVVVTCLACLDAGNEDFGGESEMMDVRFIEKIISKLSEIPLYVR
ncbi:hypothetical protein F5X99DRAFT_431989 [Biscogniauxia marginata]|nr:hypothetical protein F5X99DRAFT_431989 [Biscogniauxia marginata]